MKLVTALRLGRISNIPTVWSNVLAGATLAGVGLELLSVFIVLLAMSLVYSSGMFFNDVFDREYDRQHRSDRPIPAGEASTTSVSFWGAAMMLAALLLLGSRISFSALGSWYPLIAGLVLCALVLLYDWRHKANPFGPLIMGCCRGMVYITAAFSLAPEFSLQLGIAALCITAWVLGLTMVAKKKNVFAGFIVLVVSVSGVIFTATGQALGLPEQVILSLASVALVYVFVYRCRDGKYWNPVTLLISSISLLDAMVIVSVTGSFIGLAAIAAGLFFVTLSFQRFIEGS
jgi:hypothetical protein